MARIKAAEREIRKAIQYASCTTANFARIGYDGKYPTNEREADAFIKERIALHHRSWVIGSLINALAYLGIDYNKPIYDYNQIATELRKTADGAAYFGNALRVAKDIPGIDDLDRSVLDDYACGRYTFENRMKLQDIANKIYRMTK